jgi:hypothetical protein
MQVVGAILVVNKMQTGSERDIFFDNYFGEVGQGREEGCERRRVQQPCIEPNTIAENTTSVCKTLPWALVALWLHWVYIPVRLLDVYLAIG